LAASASPTFVSVGSIIIDDIVFPDGTTCMEVLGGGAVHAAAGMQVWGQKAGIFACMGEGMPEAVMARLERDFDLQGVLRLPVPQIRAWQIFEWDTRRTEVYRVDIIRPFIDDPQPDMIGDTYQHSQAFHVLRDGQTFLRWREHYPDALLFWEPNQPYMLPENRDEFRKIVSLADVVSPNLLEAQQIYGFHDAPTLLKMLLDDGAKVVALRLGEQGSLAGMQDSPDILHIPAAPVPNVVDQTGAGNTYCGGFMVGWHLTHDLLTAACYGAASASFALEKIGVLDYSPSDEAKRDARYRWLSSHTTSSAR
jgi:cytidine kinase